MKKYYKNALILFLGANMFLSCQKKTVMEEANYGTNATCAPQYPITLYQGVFYAPNEEFVLINERNLNGPWGASGSSYAVGDGFEPIPNKFKVGFYSDAEDAFFEGEFELPYENIKSLFAEVSDDPFFKDKTFPDTQSGKELPYMKYDALNVGISLDGLVIIWVSGKGVQKQVGKFKAKKTEKNWQEVFEHGTREENKIYNMQSVFEESIKKEIATNSLPKNRWESYFEKVKWNYDIEFSSPSTLESVHFDAVNAEAITIYGNNPKIAKDEAQERTFPYNFEIIYINDNHSYKARIVFASDKKYYENIYLSKEIERMPADLKDILSYDAFLKIDKTKPASFFISINKENNDAAVFLQQEESKIKIENCVVAVFNAD